MEDRHDTRDTKDSKEKRPTERKHPNHNDDHGDRFRDRHRINRRSGAPAGPRAGVAINNFDSFTWESATGTLTANTAVPGPFEVLAFAGFGMARRRRNR
ncbi:MAG: hypothetical protein QMB94_11280 [Phycisphaerales bacterium]